MPDHTCPPLPHGAGDRQLSTLWEERNALARRVAELEDQLAEQVALSELLERFNDGLIARADALEAEVAALRAGVLETMQEGE